MGGGGVDGAIHEAGGPRILEACRQERERRQGLLPIGEAVITTGGDLAARHVIHTVGPRYGIDPDPPALLRAAYANSLALATEHGLRTVAFPSISTGAYGYPILDAAAVALSAIYERLTQPAHGLSEVRLVLFHESDRDVYAGALAEL